MRSHFCICDFCNSIQSVLRFRKISQDHRLALGQVKPPQNFARLLGMCLALRARLRQHPFAYRSCGKFHMGRRTRTSTHAIGDVELSSHPLSAFVQCCGVDGEFDGTASSAVRCAAGAAIWVRSQQRLFSSSCSEVILRVFH